MHGEGLFGTREIQALGAGLEVAALRQRLIANNLANADTPGYRALDVDFERAFRAALSGEEAPEAAVTRGPAFGADGNGVDLDEQMAELAKTGLQYEATSRMLALALERFRAAITGRA